MNPKQTNHGDFRVTPVIRISIRLSSCPKQYSCSQYPYEIFSSILVHNPQKT